MRTSSRWSLTWVRINLVKILCVTLFAVSLISISINVHFSYVVSVNNQTIVELEKEVNELTLLCSEQNIYNLIKNITNLKNQVTQINNTLSSLSDEKDSLIEDKEFLQSLLGQREDEIQALNQRISSLENQLRLVLIKVTGFVTTEWLNSWDQALSITFKSGGSRHIASLTNGGRPTYEIRLQNHQTYLVTLMYEHYIQHVLGD